MVHIYPRIRRVSTCRVRRRGLTLMSLTLVMEKSGTILIWSCSARKVSSSGVSAGWSVFGRAMAACWGERTRGCKGSLLRPTRRGSAIFASVGAICCSVSREADQSFTVAPITAAALILILSSPSSTVPHVAQQLVL